MRGLAVSVLFVTGTLISISFIPLTSTISDVIALDNHIPSQKLFAQNNREAPIQPESNNKTAVPPPEPLLIIPHERDSGGAIPKTVPIQSKSKPLGEISISIKEFTESVNSRRVPIESKSESLNTVSRKIGHISESTGTAGKQNEIEPPDEKPQEPLLEDTQAEGRGTNQGN